MTESAKSFITPLSVSAISGQKVSIDMFDVESEMNFGHNLDLTPKFNLIMAKTPNAYADKTSAEQTSVILLYNRCLTQQRLF